MDGMPGLVKFRVTGFVAEGEAYNKSLSTKPRLERSDFTTEPKIWECT